MIYDAIILGGGPAGSTAAAVLARAGRRVLVLERERFPRYHIGESLLPGVLPFLEAVGALERVQKHGFTTKTGQTFVWGANRHPWGLDFSDLDAYPYSFFVLRSEFDQLLLQNARDWGAEVREQHEVLQVLWQGERAVGVEVRGPSGAERLEAPFLVDATGQRALVATASRLRRYQRGLRNLAIWSYWKGVKRLPDNPGHIFTVSVPAGWIWVIPLHDGTTSVGGVTSHRHCASKKQLESWVRRVIGDCAEMVPLFRDAEMVSSIRTARDWSYRSKEFAGPGWFLAGDAAAFVDPILSTGVNLAMNAGWLAGLSIHTALTHPEQEAMLRQFFELAYNEVFDMALSQVKFFYRAEGRRDSNWWKARRLLELDPWYQTRLSFLFLTSGLARHYVLDRPDSPTQALTTFSQSRLAVRPWAGPGERTLLRERAWLWGSDQVRRPYEVSRNEWQIEFKAARGEPTLGRKYVEILDLVRTPSQELAASVICDWRVPGGLAFVETQQFSLSVAGQESPDEPTRAALLCIAQVARDQDRDRISLVSFVEALRKRLAQAEALPSGFVIAPPPDRTLQEQPFALEFACGDRRATLLCGRRVDAAGATIRTRRIEARLLGPDTENLRGLVNVVQIHLSDADKGRKAELSQIRRSLADVLAAPGVLPQGWRLAKVSITKLHATTVA